MTDMRTAEISGLFSRWLERYSPPQSIRDNERAQQDEAAALLGVILKFAPRSDYADFTARVLDQVEYQMKTRAWPTKGELGAVCSNLRKSADWARKDLSGEERDMSPAGIAARRMQAGEPVGECWLWGSGACEIAARGLVDRATMDRYRSGAFLARKAIYGEASALAWETARKADHEAAKAVWKARNDHREDPAIGPKIPDKRDVPSWGTAAE